MKRLRIPALVVPLFFAACEDHSNGDGHETHGADAPGDHDAESEHSGEIHLSREAITASEIEIGAVERRALTGGAGLPAELSFDPLSTAHVAPLTSGRYTRIAVN